MRYRIALALALAAALALGLVPSLPLGAALPAIADQVVGPYVGLWTTGAAGQSNQLTQLGVGWTRTVALWSSVQPAPGSFNFSDLDSQVNAATGNGRRVLMIVRNNPTSWAAASRCTITTAGERTNLANFLATLVARYKDRVSYWQLYNEMDNTSQAFDDANDLGGCFATASGTTPTQTGRDNYARMVEVVGAAIHSADPNAKVIMGGVVSGGFLGTCPPGNPNCIFDPGFVQGVTGSLRNAGTLDRLDYVAVHFFSSQTVFFPGFGPDLIGRVNKLRQDMRNAGLTEAQLKPIVMDEGSYTDTISASTSDPNNPFNIAQRNYLTKALTRSAAADLVAYFWFWIQDANGGLGGDNAYGLIALDGTPKPSFHAMQFFQSQISRQDQFVGQPPTGNAKLEAYAFSTNDGRQAYIIWNQTDTQAIPYTPPFGTAGAITDPTGALVAPSGQTVTVGADPRFIFTPDCTPRPNLGLTVVPAGGGRLQVTVAAGTSAGLPNNRLANIQFGAGNNILVDIPGGQTGAAGNFTVNLPQVTGTTFQIRRADTNTTNGTIPFTVIDSCGAWPTFAGGGPAAWAAAGASSVTSASPMPTASAPASVNCSPRPAVDIASEPDGAGRLKVTISATGSGNRLREIRVGAATNATLDIGDHAGVDGPLTVPLPDDTQHLTALVHRTVPNQPATASLVIVDGCGEWPTLVGGGANAF